MRYLWNRINLTKFKTEWKTKLFLLLSVSIFGVLGFLFWVILHPFVSDNLCAMLCFIGYPGIFLGFPLAILYLYHHEF